MKYLAWFIGILVSIVAAVYVVLFTPFGNSLLQPVIEKKIIEQTKLESKLTSFALNMSSFAIVLELDKNNIIYLSGNYSLFSQAFNVAYRVKLEKLESLKSLTNAPLRGSLFTEGVVKGTLAFIEVDGKSSVAKSDTSYHVELKDFNPTSIIAKVKEADLATLLFMGGEKAYAQATLNLTLNFKNIVPHALDGDVLLETKNGKIDTKLMAKEFALKIPNTEFSMKLDAKLKGDDVDYSYLLSSNLAKITSSGKIIPEPLDTDIKYSIDVKELALFKPMTGADIRGAMKLSGKVKGGKSQMLVDGVTDFAGSDTSFKMTLKDFAPQKMNLKMKDLQLENLLYMINQPHYADGTLSLDVDISDAKVGNLKGVVKAGIENGVVDSKYLTEAFEFKPPMPGTSFKLASFTKLNGDFVDTKLNLISSLANLDIENVRLNIKEGSIQSDYATKIHNLDKLYFVSQRHLNGSLSVDGVLKKAKDLELSMHSKVAGGVVEAKLHNDDFHADINSVQTVQTLRILTYPEIFKASLNATLDYNLQSQSGKLKGDLVEGAFTKNQALDLIKKYAKSDLYVERFKGGVNADIDKEMIVASLDLQSNKSSIKSKDAKLNSKTKKMDASVEIVANEYPINVNLKGDVASPAVNVDLKKLMESKTGEVIQKEVTNLLKNLF